MKPIESGLAFNSSVRVVYPLSYQFNHNVRVDEFEFVASGHLGDGTQQTKARRFEEVNRIAGFDFEIGKKAKNIPMVTKYGLMPMTFSAESECETDS